MPGSIWPKPYANKHVATACDACRSKRCKCDGQKPCSSCSATQVDCVYNHSDGRRHRHKQIVARKPTHLPNMSRDSAGGAVDVIQKYSEDDDKEKRIEIHRDPRSGDAAIEPNFFRSGLHEPARIARGHSCQRLTSSSRNCQPKTTTEGGRSGNPTDSPLQPEKLVMKDMQGVFATGPAESSGKTNAGRFRMPRHRLLPDTASTLPALESKRNRDDESSQASSQEQLCQRVWQVDHRRYAVPGYTRTFGNLPFSSAIKANGYPVNVQHRQSRNISAPEYLVLPLVSADESPLGRAVIDFQQLARRLMAEGTPPSQIADQGPIDVTLFFRQRLPGDPINASMWAAEMLRAFRGTFSDQLLLACAVCVASLMRWFLVPTLENYTHIPALARPTQLQRYKPHPAWVDMMIFPSFRDALVNRLRDWVEPCIKAQWNFSWPRPLEAALVRHPHSDRLSLTSEFATYVGDFQNWSLQMDILEQFPELHIREFNTFQE